MPDDDRAQQVERFRAAQRAPRLHLLTAITPLRAGLDRFMVIEDERGATLRRCLGVPLRAGLDQGQDRPIPPDSLAGFLAAVEQAGAAWASDALPDGAWDGTTIIIERATADRYDITHLVAPRPGTPHARLLAAWLAAFPDVRRALR